MEVKQHPVEFQWISRDVYSNMQFQFETTVNSLYEQTYGDDVYNLARQTGFTQKNLWQVIRMDAGQKYIPTLLSHIVVMQNSKRMPLGFALIRADTGIYKFNLEHVPGSWIVEIACSVDGSIAIIVEIMKECARRDVEHVYLSAMLHLAKYFVSNNFNLLDIHGNPTMLPSDLPKAFDVFATCSEVECLSKGVYLDVDLKARTIQLVQKNV